MLNGQKIWISWVDVSDYAVVVARMTPAAEAEKLTRGISMFLVDMKRKSSKAR